MFQSKDDRIQGERRGAREWPVVDKGKEEGIPRKDVCLHEDEPV